MRYEMAVTIPKALDDQTRRFLDAVQRSANRLVRFSGDARSIRLIVEVAGDVPGGCDESCRRGGRPDLPRLQ